MSKKILSCAVCLEDITENPDFLPCVHAFHTDCINQWIVEKPICPVCKVPIYISTPDQLARYNNYNERQTRIMEEESLFFQALSAGRITQQPNEPEHNAVFRRAIGDTIDPNINRINFLNRVSNNISNNDTPDVDAFGEADDMPDLTYSGDPEYYSELFRIISNNENRPNNNENRPNNIINEDNPQANDVYRQQYQNHQNYQNARNNQNYQSNIENSILNQGYNNYIYHYAMLVQTLNAAISGNGNLDAMTAIDNSNVTQHPVDQPADGVSDPPPNINTPNNQVTDVSHSGVATSPNGVVISNIRDAVERFELANQLIDAIQPGVNSQSEVRNDQ